MNWMNGIISNNVSETIGWTLVNSLWQAGLVALPISVLFSLFPNMTAKTRAAISYSGVMSIFILAIITLCWCIPISAPLDSVIGPIGVQANMTQGIQIDPSTAQNAVFPLAFLRSLLASQMPTISFLWLVGVFIASSHLGSAVWQLRRLKINRQIPVHAGLQAQLSRLKKRLGIMRPVALFASRRIVSPIVFGHLRPVILFPVSLLTSAPLEQIEALLAHELAHIKRHDYLLNMGLRMVKTLFFFNPGILWLCKTWEAERETSCDQMATDIGVRPSNLAEALLGVRQLQHSLLTLTPAALGHGSLKERIRRIFGEPSSPRVKPTAIGTLPLLFITVFTALWMIQTPAVARPASEIFQGFNQPLVKLPHPAPPLNTKQSTVQLTVDTEEKQLLLDWMERLRKQIEALGRQKQTKESGVQIKQLQTELNILARLITKAPNAPLPPLPSRATITPITALEPTMPNQPTPVEEPLTPTAAMAPPSPPPAPTATIAPVPPLIELEDFEQKQMELQAAMAELESKRLEQQAENLTRIDEQVARQKAQLKSAQKYEMQRLETALAQKDALLKKAQEAQEAEEQTIEAELLRLNNDQINLEIEHKRLEKEQATQEMLFKLFEDKLTVYLLKHKLIPSAADFKNIEITKDYVRLSGKELTEPHRHAILEITKNLFGDKMAGPDQRIVIQR